MTWQLYSLFQCSEPLLMRIWIISFSLSYPFFLSRTSENVLKVLWHRGIVLVPLWCKLLQCELVSNVLPQFTAAVSSPLSSVRGRHISHSRRQELARPEGATVQHRWRGASSPGRYRLLPAAVLECLHITDRTARALAWLVYWGAEPPWVLPLHCTAPGLITLPETDVHKTAITSLEYTEPRHHDNEFDLPSRPELTPCKISLQSTVELLCREIRPLAPQRAALSQRNVLIWANMLPDKSNTKLIRQISTPLDLYPV